jgi:hypothetical protein
MAYEDPKPASPAPATNAREGENRRQPKRIHGTRLAGDASGINVDDRKPIDPRMPSLPPA